MYSHSRAVLLVFACMSVCAPQATTEDAYVGPDSMGNLCVNASEGGGVLVNGRDVNAELRAAASAATVLQSAIASLRAELSAIKASKVVRLYAIGGNNGFAARVDSFDGLSWTVQSLPAEAQRYSAGMAVLNGYMHVVGGVQWSTPLASVFKFDGTTWTAATSMNIARGWPGVVEFNGLLYAIGGRGTLNSTNYLSSFERFDGSTWVIGSKSMFVPRESLAAAVFGLSVYVTGGFNGLRLSSVERFEGDSFSSAPSMLRPRSGHGAVVYHGLLYVAGGRSNLAVLASVEMFDGVSWFNGPTMLSPRHSFGLAVYNDLIYAVAGSNQTTFVGSVEQLGLTGGWTMTDAAIVERAELAVGVY